MYSFAGSGAHSKRDGRYLFNFVWHDQSQEAKGGALRSLTIGPKRLKHIGWLESKLWNSRYGSYSSPAHRYSFVRHLGDVLGEKVAPSLSISSCKHVAEGTLRIGLRSSPAFQTKYMRSVPALMKTHTGGERAVAFVLRDRWWQLECHRIWVSARTPYCRAAQG